MTSTDTSLFQDRRSFLITKGDQVYWKSGDNLKPILPDGCTLLSLYYIKETNQLFIQKDKKIYLYKIDTQILTETSIPQAQSGETVYEEIGLYLAGQSGKNFIFTFSKYDKNSEEYKNEFAGPLPVSEKYYQYDIANNTVKDADYINEIWSLTGIASGPLSNLSLDVWDDKKNIFLGHLVGEGIGHSTPVYSVDLNNKKITETKQMMEAQPFFNQWGKGGDFVITKKSDEKLTLAFYDIAQPQKEEKSYQLTIPDPIYGLSTVVWNDQKAIIVFKNQFDELNLTTGTQREVYKDFDQAPSLANFNWYSVNFLDNNHIIFVDWESTNKNDPINGKHVNIIKTVDLNTNETQEIYRSISEEGSGFNLGFIVLN